MSKKIDSKKVVVATGSTHEPDTTRRDMALTLASFIGASAFLKGCAAPGADGDDAMEEEDQLAEATEALVGGNFLWFDTYAELRLLSGGPAATNRNIAICRDPKFGGLFGWSTVIETDNNGTIIVPTPPPNGPRPSGCWKRIYSGAIDVRWFGAKGDNVNPDRTAIQAAVTHALRSGEEVYFPPGFYLIDESIQIGKMIYQDADFKAIVERTTTIPYPPASQSTETGNRIGYRPISLTFAPNAYLVVSPNFIRNGTTPTPVIAYHLDRFYGYGHIRNLNVVSQSAVTFNQTTKKFEVHNNVVSFSGYENIVGLLLSSRGCCVDTCMFIGIEYGLVAIKPYNLTISNVRAYGCGDAVNIAEGNGMTVSDVLMFYCKRGVVFDGSGSQIRMINTEQVDEDLVIFSADTCTFGPGYMEDGRTDNLSNLVHVKTGGLLDDEFNRVTHCVYDNLRIGGKENKKRAIVMNVNYDVTFINVRTNSSVPNPPQHRPVYADIGVLPTVKKCYGTLINCDFSDQLTPSFRWTSLSSAVDLGVAASIGSYETNRRLVATLYLPYADTFLDINPQESVPSTKHVHFPFTPNLAHDGYSIQFQRTTDSANDLVVMSARIEQPQLPNHNHYDVLIRATNPTGSPITQNFDGQIIIHLFKVLTP